MQIISNASHTKAEGSAKLYAQTPRTSQGCGKKAQLAQRAFYISILCTSETSQRGFTILQNCKSSNEGLLLASLSFDPQRDVIFCYLAFDCRDVLL